MHMLCSTVNEKTYQTLPDNFKEPWKIEEGGSGWREIIHNNHTNLFDLDTMQYRDNEVGQ